MEILQVCYWLIIVADVSYSIRSDWKDYKSGQPLQKATRSSGFYVVYISLVASILFLSTSLYRIVAFALMGVTAFLYFTIAEVHNQKHNSGELYSYYQKEFKKGKRIVVVFGGAMLLCMLFLEWFKRK